jgi:hypothetical protein
MSLPFDDWTETDTPFHIESLRWFEVEAGGPGRVNRLATVTGILLTQIADARDIGDGIITLDTGYALNPNSDQWSGLIDGQTGPLVSCYVVLASIGGQDDAATGGNRNGWLESVDANFQSVGNQLDLFLTIKANLDGDIAFMRIGYQVILLFNSNRPPAMMPVGILVGEARTRPSHGSIALRPPASEMVKTVKSAPVRVTAPPRGVPKRPLPARPKRR